MGGCDIQKCDLIGPLTVIVNGTLHRVAHFFDPYKVDAFYHLAVPHIQAGNNSFG